MYTGYKCPSDLVHRASEKVIHFITIMSLRLVKITSTVHSSYSLLLHIDGQLHLLQNLLKICSYSNSNDCSDLVPLVYHVCSVLTTNNSYKLIDHNVITKYVNALLWHWKLELLWLQIPFPSMCHLWLSYMQNLTMGKISELQLLNRPWFV